MKKSIFLALTAMLALSFVACGKDKGNNDTSSSDSSSVEISTPVESESSEDSSEVSSEAESSSSEAESESSSSEAESESSSEESSSEPEIVTYTFTKIVDRWQGLVSSEDLEVGAELDLSDPDPVAGKKFLGWVDQDSNPVTAGTMPEGDYTIYASFELIEYTVTIDMPEGTEDVVIKFAVEETMANPDLVPLYALGSIVEDALPQDTDTVKYTVAGMPEDGEWKLENYTLTVTKEAVALTVEEAVEIGVNNASKVTNGTLKYESGEFVLEDISYELAENYYYNEYVDSWGDTCKEWYVGYGDGKVLALQDMGYGVSKQYIEPVADMAKGYAFEMLFDYTNTYYGVETFVSAIYGFADEKVESCEEGVYSFSLVYVNEDETKHEIAVSFTLNDDGAMDTVSVAIETYYMSDLIVYDEEGNVVTDDAGNTVTERGYEETADSSKLYTITQATDGEVVVEYDPEKVLVSSYTLKDADGEEVESLDLVAGTAATLTIADVPETAVVKYDTFTATVLDSDGTEVDSGVVNVYVNTYSNTIDVTAYAAGEYTITIESAFVTKTLTASVVLPETTEIYAYANWTRVTATEIYDDGAFTFQVKANAYADASALVEITAYPEGAEASVEETAGIWTFTPDLAGEYTITITSMAEETLTWTVTITVNEAPAIETVLNGEYQNVGKTEDDNLYVWFMYDAGIVLVTYEGEVYNYSTWSFETVKYCAGYNFTYDAATKAITLELAALTGLEEMYPGFVENENVLTSIKLGADYKMTVVYCNGNKQAKLETWVELPQAEPIEDVAGEYRMMVGTYGEEDYGRWVLGLNADGTGAFYKQIYNSNTWTWMTTEYIVEFNFTVAEDYSIEITEITSGEVEGFDMDTVNNSIVWADEVEGDYGLTTTIAFTFNGESCTFEIVS